MDNFYIVGDHYKHISYSEVLQCTGFTETHVILQGAFTTYLFPKDKRHTWIYKKNATKNLNIK
jgi:hypothetical protein